MTDKCQYPSCRAPLVSFMYRGDKTVGLCDQHLDHVLSENRKLVMATEKTLKLPPIETGARMAKPEEEDIYCCAPGCNHPVGLFYGNKPVCHEHAKNHEYVPFDGTYRKRKIIIIERPVAAKNAVVVKGSGTGNEKREKNRKIYPVNPTRGIPLPAKEPIDVEDERQQLAEEKESLKKMSKYYKQVETMKKEKTVDPSLDPNEQSKLTEEEQDMVKAEKTYKRPTKTARAKKAFVKAVQEAPENDINAILARLNSGELEMSED